MRGPLPKGTLAQDNFRTDWEISRNYGRGAIYRVTEQFTDMHGHKHLPGETWRFICSEEDRYSEVFLIGVEINEQQYEIYFDMKIPAQVDILYSLHFKVKPVSW